MKNILSGVLFAVVAMGGIGMSHASTSHQTREMPQKKFVKEHRDDYQTVAPYQFAGILMGLLQEVKGSPQTWKLPPDFNTNFVFFDSLGRRRSLEDALKGLVTVSNGGSKELILRGKSKECRTKEDFIDAWLGRRPNGTIYQKKLQQASQK